MTGIPSVTVTGLNVDETLMQKEVNEMLGKDVLAEYLYENDMVAKSTIAVNMIPPVSDVMENKIAEIGEVVRGDSWDLVYAKDENTFEDLWQNMVKKAKDLGMDEVEKYYKKAWKEALKKAAEFENTDK